MALAIAGAVLLVVCVVLLLIRRSQQAKLMEISGTETSTSKQLIEAARYVSERMGEKGSFNKTTEVKGIIRCDSPITSEIAKQPCVYYSMSVTREYEEDYWETDSQNNQRVRKTRRSSENVASNSQRVSFWVEDETGRVLVDPTGASVDAVQVVDRFAQGRLGADNAVVSLGAFSFDMGGLLGGVMSGSQTLGYRFRESVVPLDRDVYVLGEATDRSGKLAIMKPREKGHKFIISLKSEEELIRSTGSKVLWLLVGAIASGAAGLGLIVAGLAGR